MPKKTNYYICGDWYVTSNELIPVHSETWIKYLTLERPAQQEQALQRPAQQAPHRVRMARAELGGSGGKNHSKI